MPYTLDASVHVTLPDDPVAMAEAMTLLAGAWMNFVSALPDDAERHYGITQTRAKAKPGKRSSKLRVIEPPPPPDLVA